MLRKTHVGSCEIGASPVPEVNEMKTLFTRAVFAATQSVARLTGVAADMGRYDTAVA